MKAALIFYSLSGNTRGANLFLIDRLASHDIIVDVIDLRPTKEATSFLRQCVQAFSRLEVDLENTVYDLTQYDFVIFSSPVWAFTIAPALRSYLRRVASLENKKVGCFLTYGSGSGSQRALKEIITIVRKKKADVVFSTNLKGNKAKTRDYLEERFKSLLEDLQITGH